jgi:hypothetical protein
MARRLDAEPARNQVHSGRALLVCAYDQDEKCEKYRLAGGLSLSELQAQEATLPKDREMIFYCA